ncbi:MAG: flippase-like domain-containing protein [Mycoplasma sp.]|nr:flippase-like domain-containing protein [Candidatus Hennigella equi]
MKTKKKDIKTKTIEDKAENKTFFTKRNVIILIVTALVAIGLTALTFLVIFNPEIWGTFFINIGEGLKVNFGAMWLTFLIIFAIINIFYNMLPFWLRLNSLGIKINFGQWISFALSISFLKAITPANFIYDPYTVFWLKTQGVSTSRATSMMFSNAFLWQSAVLLIHIPSFALILTRANLLISQSALGVFWLVLMCIGIIIDIIGVLVMALLCFSKKAHYVMSSVFNWFKKKLHMKYHTKAEIEEKYKTKATLKREVIEYYKDWSTTLINIFILVAYELIVYFTLSASLALINANSLFTFDVVYVFHSANMACNANRINIFPAQGAGLEAALLLMLKSLGGIKGGSTLEDQEKFIQQGIVLWRAFFTYIPAILGLCGFTGLTIYQVRSFKNKRGSFIENKYE